MVQLIERADRGDREALWRLYGMAGAWLRKGIAPPAPLDGWIAQRLDALAVTLKRSANQEDTKRQLRDHVLRIVAPRQPGRPARRRTATKAAALAMEVDVARVDNRTSATQAAKLIARRRHVSPKTVEAAASKRQRR
jgi:hypothetical protein